MARVRNELGKLIKDLDRVTASVAFVGPTRAAVQVVVIFPQDLPVWLKETFYVCTYKKKIL